MLGLTGLFHHVHVFLGCFFKQLGMVKHDLLLQYVSALYAMTGELNLSGEVMPIGGVKEKILAAKRNNVPHVILPNKNKHHLADMKDITEGIDIILVSHADEVLERVLLPKRNLFLSLNCRR